MRSNRQKIVRRIVLAILISAFLLIIYAALWFYVLLPMAEGAFPNLYALGPETKGVER